MKHFTLSEYSELEQCLWKLHIIDTSLHTLQDACFSSPNPLAPSIAAKYGCVDLENFIQCYDNLLGLVDKQDKNTILLLDELIKEILQNKEGIKKIRNNWIAHIQDDDKFSKDIATFAREINMDKSMDDYFVMFSGINIFVQVLKRIFSVQFELLLDKSGHRTAHIKQEFFHHDLINLQLDSKMQITKRKLQLEHQHLLLGIVPFYASGR